MGRARAMMNHAGFDDYFNKKSWCEAISTATKLDNIMVKHMGGNLPAICSSKNTRNTASI